jgi:very-short-patch-repair endonuclease
MQNSADEDSFRSRNRARLLRSTATSAEARLWHHLRRKNIEGPRFRRQFAIGKYIVDFVCLPARLIVEVDGGVHILRQAQDESRAAWLESQRFRIIRFRNNEVFENIDHVIECIRLQVRSSPPPTPSRKGRGTSTL